MDSSSLGAVCDEFYVNCRLFLKLDMALGRETVLNFFDRVRRAYPGLTKLRQRENGGLLLEEEADAGGSRRWLRLDSNSLRFGYFSPPDLDSAQRFSEMVLTQAPYYLTFSEIDFDHLDLVYGFDLSYRGNHDQLVAETLLGESAAVSMLLGDDTQHIIDVQPYFGISLSPQCDLQAYVEVKSRTTTYEVRTGSFEGDPISVFLTIRKYWGVDRPTSLTDGMVELFEKGTQLATDKVVPNFVNALAAAIASRS